MLSGRKSWLHRPPLLVQVKTGKIHVGGACDFQVALRTEHDKDFVAESFYERGFIGSGDVVLLGGAESITQQR